MARWQVMMGDTPTGETVDDRYTQVPGEDGFDDGLGLLLAIEHGGDGVSYMGRSEPEA